MKIVALFVAAVIVSGCGGAEQRKAKYLSKGKDYIEQQNYDKALVELKNVLQIDPKQAEAYYLIGQVEEKKKNFGKAFGNYAKAVELKPDYLDAKVKLGLFNLLGGNVEEASKISQEILKAQPAFVPGRTLKALLMTKKGDIKGAIHEAEDIIKADPAQSDAVDLLVSLYRKQGDTGKVMQLLTNAIAANPKNTSMRLQLVVVLVEKKDLAKAEQVLQEVVAIQPDQFQHRATLASFYFQTKQADKAEKTLREAIQADTEDAQRYLALADFFVGQKKLSQAETELQAAIKSKPKLYKLRLGLASFYEQSGVLDKAADVYRETISEAGIKPDGLIARTKLAMLMFLQGKQEEAAKLTEEVLKENPGDNNALLVKGKLSLIKGDLQSAIAAFRTVSRDQPDLTDTYLYLADAHIQNKQPELAKESLMKAVELNPKDAKVRLALAKYYVRSGDTDTAVKKVDEALKLFPNDYDVLEAKYEVLLAKKDIKGAQAILGKIKAAHPGKPFSYYQLGQLYMVQHKYDAAIKEFEATLPISKDTYSPMAAIVNAYMAQKKPEKAIARLHDALAKEPSAQPFVHELLAEVYIQQKKFPEAEQALRKAIEANPKWNVPYRNLANIYLMSRDFSSAGQLYEQGLKAIPDDTQLSLLLAENDERTRAYEKAIATYERVLKKSPENTIAANNLASLLLDYRTDADSLKRARELTTRFESSSQPAFTDTLGWMYYRSGELDKAIGLMEKVVKQVPNSRIFRFHLGMAYYKKGNLQAAKSHLAKAVEGKNDYSGFEEAKTTLKKIQ